MNRFQISLDRIKKNVYPQDNWGTDDWDHYKTVVKALEFCANISEKERNFADGIQKDDDRMA